MCCKSPSKPVVLTENGASSEFIVQRSRLRVKVGGDCGAIGKLRHLNQAIATHDKHLTRQPGDACSKNYLRYFKPEQQLMLQNFIGIEQ